MATAVGISTTSPTPAPTPKPNNCEWSDWGGWEPCSHDCGIGVTHRKRFITQNGDFFGKKCSSENNKERKRCYSQSGCDSPNSAKTCPHGSVRLVNDQGNSVAGSGTVEVSRAHREGVFIAFTIHALLQCAPAPPVRSRPVPLHLYPWGRAGCKLSGSENGDTSITTFSTTMEQIDSAKVIALENQCRVTLQALSFAPNSWSKHPTDLGYSSGKLARDHNNQARRRTVQGTVQVGGCRANDETIVGALSFFRFYPLHAVDPFLAEPQWGGRKALSFEHEMPKSSTSLVHKLIWLELSYLSCLLFRLQLVH